MSEIDKIVCFDLGGVLVQIRHAWDEAMLAVGLEPHPKHKIHLNHAPDFAVYQDGLLDRSEYLDRLAAWLEVTPSVAMKVHAAILDKDYPDSLRLVQDVKARGSLTSCFSNTNVLHWEELCSPQLHPAIAALDVKFASHELFLAKPNRVAFEAVEAQLPKNSGIIFFDDTLPNVEAANDCGWQAFHVDPFNNPPLQMRDILNQLQLLEN